MRESLDRDGVLGWMADFGEWCPFDTPFYRYNEKTQARERIDAIAGHNAYPQAWANLQNRIKTAYSAQNSDTLGIFMRSATSPIPHIYWAGDQNTNWGKNDGLPSLVPALLSTGMSGIGINHGDIGGFTSFKKAGFKMTRSRELLYRWIELCAFTPVFSDTRGFSTRF